MASTIGVAHVTLYLDDSFSLKDKRRVVRSISARVRDKFNAGIAEVADLNDMRVATLGIVCISNQASHADEMLATIVQFIERNLELGVVGEIETELIHI
jgi:uncharacterized protein YlxP (DUF503 family)